MDWYDILGFDAHKRHAITDEDIRKKYKQLALQFHPDKCGGDHDTFIKIRQAYEILSDKDRRTRYDHTIRRDCPVDVFKHIILGMARRIPAPVSWDPDIYISVPMSTKRYHVTYTVQRHNVCGSVITFSAETLETTFDIPADLEGEEEYLIIEGHGNEVIEGGRVKRGDLLVDVST